MNIPLRARCECSHAGINPALLHGAGTTPSALERRHGNISQLLPEACMIRWLTVYWLAQRAARLARKLERERRDHALKAQSEFLDILFPPEERRPRRCGHDHSNE